MASAKKEKPSLEILKKNPRVVTWSWSVSVSVPGRNRDLSVRRFDTGEPRTGTYTRGGLPQGWRFTAAALSEQQSAYGYYVRESWRAESCTMRAFKRLKAESAVMVAGCDDDGAANQPWERLKLQTVKQLRAKHYRCSPCEIKCVCVCNKASSPSHRGGERRTFDVCQNQREDGRLQGVRLRRWVRSRLSWAENVQRGNKTSMKQHEVKEQPESWQHRNSPLGLRGLINILVFLFCCSLGVLKIYAQQTKQSWIHLGGYKK